jgi:hypothetical protein
MEKTVANGKLEITLPDGFHLMDEEEKNKLNVVAGGEFIAFADPERHITATVGWRDLGLASLLVGSSDAVKTAEKQIGDAMQRFGYEFTGFVDRNISGRSCRGFDYTYRTGDTGMGGETCAMKSGRYMYFFNAYFRQEHKEESLDVWKGILASAVRI